MGFFKSTKGSIISDTFYLMEGVLDFSKGMYDVALYEDHLEITSKQKRKLLLDYDQITDVFYGVRTALVDKPKSIIGRAAIGGILFGSTGAVIGAASAMKQEKETKIYFIISYSSSGGEDRYIQFEDTKRYKGLKISKKLEEFAHIGAANSEQAPQIQKL